MGVLEVIAILFGINFVFSLFIFANYNVFCDIKERNKEAFQKNRKFKWYDFYRFQIIKYMSIVHILVNLLFVTSHFATNIILILVACKVQIYELDRIFIFIWLALFSTYVIWLMLYAKRMKYAKK